MNFLKRIFGEKPKARKGEDASRLARQLETLVTDAERLVAAGRHEEALQVAETGLK